VAKRNTVAFVPTNAQRVNMGLVYTDVKQT